MPAGIIAGGEAGLSTAILSVSMDDGDEEFEARAPDEAHTVTICDVFTALNGSIRRSHF